MHAPRLLSLVHLSLLVSVADADDCAAEAYALVRRVKVMKIREGSIAGVCDYNGNDLEAAYGCDCSGCDCDAAAVVTSSPTPSPTPSPSPLPTCDAEVVASGRRLSSCAANCYGNTCQYYEDLGNPSIEGVCDYNGNDLEAAVRLRLQRLRLRRGGDDAFARRHPLRRLCRRPRLSV